MWGQPKGRGAAKAPASEAGPGWYRRARRGGMRGVGVAEGARDGVAAGEPAATAMGRHRIAGEWLRRSHLLVG